ncbi:MAG: hypothetical protein ACRDBX_05005 [Erysipelotrichaceae bacterium]
MSMQSKQEAISAIFAKQQEDGCWNTYQAGDGYNPLYNYYSPTYTSTLWTLILLADLQVDPHDERIKKPLAKLVEQFYDEEVGIFTLGKSHFPIPCLNGNMLYLLGYFAFPEEEKMKRVLDFFVTVQRFDDGEFKTPRVFPYYGNKSCYGAHTCYWGVVKLLKGIGFLPRSLRSATVVQLRNKCIDFILLHEVCFQSHHPTQYLHTNIKYLTFPNMYQSDVLEILWLLTREGIVDERMNKAIALLKEKQLPDGTWRIEKPNFRMVISLGKTSVGSQYVTQRAKEVLKYWNEQWIDVET